MVQAPSPALIESLKQPVSQHVLDSLHQIKNIIIGHDHRKEAAVRHGVVAPLVDIVSSRPPAEATSVSNGDAPFTSPLIEQWRQSRLQATIVLASLASGGPAFAAPLLRAHVLDNLLAQILAESSDELITVSLRAIRNFFQSLAASEGTEKDSLSPDNELHTNERELAFVAVLRKLDQRQSRRYDSLLFEIIANSCDSAHPTLIALNEETVAYLLSRMDPARYSPLSGQNSSQHQARVPTASLFAALSGCLAVMGQHSFTSTLAHTNALVAKLSSGMDDNRQSESSSEGPRYGHSKPAVWKTTTSSKTADHATAQQYSAMVWLIDAARSSTAIARLAVLQLITTIHTVLMIAEKSLRDDERSKITQRPRCGLLALSAVPLCVRLIEECAGPPSLGDSIPFRDACYLRERCCQTLAPLIANSRELQVAAVQAGAVKHICAFLRRTFEKVTQTKPFWVPYPTSDQELPDTCRLGPSGLPPEIAYIMKRRSGALFALAALADRDDNHRKAIIDSNILSCVVDSLKPISPSNSNLVQGNTTGVILSACRAAQNMSRSVSLLRTSLIDAGVARPIFDLLKYHEIRVQIAATDVCANLILDVSPMREQLTACGVVDTLCQHALHGSPTLQCSSLWALKHAALEAPVEQKKKTLHTLGVEWLAATIKGNLQNLCLQSTEKASGGVTLRSVNAAGDRVDLLNPTSMDIDDSSGQASAERNDGTQEPGEDDDDDDDDDDDESNLLLYDEASNTHYHASSIRSTLTNADKLIPQSTLDDLDLPGSDPKLRAQREDVALQLQALDFIRNMLNGENCAEMVSYVFQHFGQQRLLSLLTEKLSPTSFLTQSLRQQQSMGNNSGRPVYYPTEIISAAIHVTIHIANGGVAHKEQLIAQRSLLQAMLSHCTHPDREVRSACVWTVHTLTWKESESDTAGRRRRAQELMAMGVFKAIQNLERDPELSVRDRVKVVLRHFAEA